MGKMCLELYNIISVCKLLKIGTPYVVVTFFIFFVLSLNIDISCSFLQGYKPADEGPSEYQSIPLSKIEDFGVHCKQ